MEAGRRRPAAGPGRTVARSRLARGDARRRTIGSEPTTSGGPGSSVLISVPSSYHGGRRPAVSLSTTAEWWGRQVTARGPYAKTSSRRAAIVRAAAEAFAESGYAAASFRDIAARAGLS